MPTYDYVCDACSLRFERQQAMTEAPLTECPECGGKIRRLVSGGVGLIVKGSRHHGSDLDVGVCSLERNGKTCCGRDERCGKPACEGDH